MMSSVIPSEKYSFSGSALMFSNGSTATKRSSSGLLIAAVGPELDEDPLVVTAGWLESGVNVQLTCEPASSAVAKSAADPNRPAGCFDNAFVIASSTLTGISLRPGRTLG